jgi:phosphomannomutase
VFEGRVIWADQLMVIWARDVLQRLPGSTIIADVKTSAVFYDEVKKAGGNPVMWKTGHSLIKSKMAELNAPLAGEMSGHIFFADEYFGFDDAMYAALRLLRILTRSGVRLEELRDKLPLMFNTPELRFECPDEKKLMIVDLVRQRLKSIGKVDICEIDGVRVEKDYGWWLLRASNTQPALVARCESKSEDGLAQLKGELGEQLMLNGIDPENLL